MCVNTHRVKVCELCEEEREPHAESSLSAGLQQVFLGNDAVLWSLFSVQVGEGGFGKQVLKNTAEWERPLSLCV